MSEYRGGKFRYTSSKRKKRRKLRSKEEIQAEMEELTISGAGDVAKKVERFPDGSRRIHLSETTKKFLVLQAELFEVTFGRKPGPGDPLFWDTKKEHLGPVPLDDEAQEEMSRALRKAALAVGVRPEIAYAMEKTGMILSSANKHLFSKEDLDEWQAAIEEYSSLH